MGMRWSGVGAAAVALTLTACGSSGVSPKALGPDGATYNAAPMESGLDQNVAEPIVVAQEVLDGFQFLYRHITTVEFVLCLEGTRRNGRLFIDGFRLARMEATSVNSVRYQPCESERYVGTAHNHPPVDNEKSLCYQSEPDRRSFGMDNRAIVDVVLCGDDRYYWVLKDGRARAETVLATVAP